MNITSPIPTYSRIARSFKTYHLFSNAKHKKSNPSLVDLQPLIPNFSQKSIDQLLQKKKKKNKNSLNSSRLVFLSFSAAERKGVAYRDSLRVKNRDENPRFPVRLRALPTRMHTSSAGARASTPRARNHALTRPSVSPRAQRRYYLIISITGR